MFNDLPWDSPIIISFVTFGFILAFLLAFGVGANDVANFFGTVVGTNTLTLYQVFIIASICEFAGSTLLGNNVSDTVRKGIVNISNIPNLYPPSSDCRRPLIPLNNQNNVHKSNTSNNTNIRTCSDVINMAISIGALLGSATWLAIANVCRLPVSTTHSIVGSTVGAGLVALGSKSVVWKEIGFIIVSWIISPVISGLISSAIYYTLYKLVLKKTNSFDLCLKVVPFIYFVTVFVNVFTVGHNISKITKYKMPVWGIVLLSLGIALIVLIFTVFFINPYTKKKINEKYNRKKLSNENSKTTATPLSSTENNRPEHEKNNVDPISTKNNAIIVTENREMLIGGDQSLEPNTPPNDHSQDIFVKGNSLDTSNNTPNNDSDATIEICDDAQRGCKDPRTNMLFHILQVIMACFGAFVHGGNDISNSISPLMNIWLTFKHGTITKKSIPPIWILVYGSVGMIIGLVILGKRVIGTIGKNITKISPASGFTIEFGSALTVLLATKLSLPVSTTHCQIGSVIAVGLIRNGRKSVNFKIILNIIISWVITLPVSGLVSAATFAAIREIVVKINS